MSRYNICSYKHQDKNNYIPSLKVCELPKHFNIDFNDRYLAFLWKKGVSDIASNAGLTQHYI